MARKQQLIHLHGTTPLTATKASDAGMVAGEIAVMNAGEAGKSELYVLTTGGTVETFITKAAVELLDADILSSAKTDATTKAGNAEAAAKSHANTLANDLQGQIDALVLGENSVATQIEAAKEELTEAIATAKGEVDTAAKGYANAAQSGATAAAKSYTDGEIETLQTSLNAAISAETEDRKTAISGVTEAIATEAAARDAADKTLQGNIDEKVDKTAYNAKVSALETKDTELAGAITTAQNAAQTYADGLITAEVTRSNKYADDKVAEEKGLREAADTQIRTDYAAADTTLKSDLTGAIATAKTEAIEAATGYTSTEIGKVNNALDTHAANATHITSDERTAWNKAVTDLNDFLTGTDTDKVVNKLSDIKQWMENDAVVETELTTAIAKETKAREDADTLLSNRIAAFEGTGTGSVTAQIEAAKGELTQDIATAKGEAIATATGYTSTEIGKVNTALNTAKSDLTQAIATAKSDLTNDIATAKGEAIDAAKTYTDTAVSGATTELKAYADKAEEDAYKAATGYTSTEIATAKSELQGNIDEKVDKTAYNAKVSALETKDTELAGAISAEETARKTAITDEENARKAAISGVTDAIADEENARKAAISGVTDAIATEKSERETADTALSNRIKAIEDAKPIDTVVVTNSDKNKITATKAEKTVTFNFDNMVIDCGEY